MPRSAAVVLYPGCVFFEIAAVVELLARTCEVNYFAPDRNVHCASNGARLLPHGSYADLAARAVDCVLVPGGNPDSILETGSANECLIGASRQGALIAGICAGNLVLARAGVLIGRRATHNYTLEHAPADVVAHAAPIWEGIAFERADLVVDGRFITAQPWAYIEFAAVVARELGVLSADEATKYIADSNRTYDDRRQSMSRPHER